MGRKRIILITSLLFAAVSLILSQDVVVTVTGTTPVSCGTGSDGTITVEITGGIGDYSLVLLRGVTPVESAGPISSNTYTFTGHDKYPFYFIIVSDEDDATGDGSANAAIGGPNPISITSAVPGDISCNGADDGTITVTASGESGNYIFDLTGTEVQSNETGIFTGLQAGTDYVVTVSDKDGCPSTDATAMMTINNPPVVSVSLDNVSDVVCFGDNTGSISITPSGGTPGGGTGYTYSWTGPGGFTSTAEDISGLEAGDYAVAVSDANLCIANLGPITVSQSPELTAVLNSTTDVTCNGGNDGTAAMTPGGGTGGYSYSWDGQFTGLISTDQNPVNLLADTYDFTLFDAGGCSRTFTDFAIIDEPGPIDVTVNDQSDVTCPGGTDGTADISPQGGTAPYTFLWSGAVSGYSSTDEDPVNMPADDFTLTITDATGTCNQVFPDLLTITEPAPLAVTLNNTTPVTCFGGDDGAVSIGISGGTPLYTADWTGQGTGHNSSDENPMDLVADTYDVLVTDNNGCTALFTGIATVIEPADISVTVDNITDVDCNGGATGAIDITPGGGTGPYTYLWSGPGGFSSTSEDISGLEAGDYSVTITDASGCFNDFVDVATVSTTTSITATFSLTDITCNGASDGTINATVSGGSPGYTFDWTGPGSFSDNTEDISGLQPGTYVLSVTDNLGCVEVFPGQNLTEPPAVTAAATVTDIDCFGASNGAIDLSPAGGVAPYSFAWTGPGGFTAGTEDLSGLGPGDYSVTITDANSCAVPFTDLATVDESPEIQVSASSLDITCNGAGDGTADIDVTGGAAPYTFAWTGPGGFSSTDEDLTGLGAGSYDLVITDANSCVVTFPALVVIGEPAPIVASLVSQVNISCNGDATGSIEIDVTGGVAPLSFQWTDEGGNTVSTLEDPTALPAGTYSLLITDNNACTAAYPDLTEITEPPAIGVSLAKTDIVCYGDNDGTITVTASGGTPPLEYSRIGDIGATYQAGNTFTGLGPGFYIIWTRDANLCVVTDTISIVEPDELQVLGETRSGANQCHGDSSGRISIDDVTGGVEPYQYSINNGADFFADPVFTNLPAGSYQTVVRDATGCEASGNLNVITQPTRLRIDSYVQEDITTCATDLDGRIVIVGAGGTGTKTYVLNDTLEVPSGDFQGLPAGNHKVTIIDQNFCFLDTLVQILAPPSIIIDNVTATDVTGCAGDANGEIAVSGSGGSGTIVYAINGGAFQGSGSFTGLPAGSHTVSLRDDNGCIVDTVVDITEPVPVTISSEIVTPITCNGAGDGVIEIVASGGTTPYSFVLNPGSVSEPSGIFSNLVPDTYTVTVNDDQGCGPVNSSPITLTDPPLFQLDSAGVDSITCNGASDGILFMQVSGGIPPYEYSIDNQASWLPDSAISGLGPGTYEAYARDANLCTVYAGPLELTEPPALILSVITTDIAGCAGDTTGRIEAAGTGGTGMLFYSLNGTDYQDSGIFVNLPAGDYSVYLQDETGCAVSIDTTISEPEPLTVTIVKTDATFGNLGSLTFTATSGGTPPYSFSIEGPSGTFSPDTAYNDLGPGTYHAVVTDQNGCTYEEMVEILDVLPLDVVINVTDVTCFGETDGSIEFVPQDAEGAVEYSIDSGLNFVSGALFENLQGDSTYHLVARDAAGKVFTGTAGIAEPPLLEVVARLTPAECNAFSETGAIDLDVSGGTGPYGFSWSDGATDEDRSGIRAGEYSVSTTDANGCQRSDTLLLNSLVIVEADAGEDTTICFGSTIRLNGQGGHTPSWSPADFLSDPDVADPLVEEITETTTYVLTISEEESTFGCFNTDTVTISLLPLTGLTASEDTFVVEGSSVSLDATGGSFTDYRWEPEAGLDDSGIRNPVATPQQSTVYTVSATNEFGCEESDSVFIEVIEDIRAYNVFTPNGDGINDFFDIENAYRFPDIVVEVYSRWGDLLFQSRGYDDGSRWDGRARNREVPTGTYYYVIIPHQGATPITGNVTIIR